jgi:hypothetical protein
MAELYFDTYYSQTRLPSVRDCSVVLLSGTFGDAVTTATIAPASVVTLPGLYGPGDYISRVGWGRNPQGSTLPNCAVELCAGTGAVVGTLYSALGTQSEVPGNFLGMPLATTSWLRVIPAATALSLGASLIVDYVHEA